MYKYIRLSVIVFLSFLVSIVSVSSTQGSQIEYDKTSEEAITSTANLPWRGGYIHHQVDPQLIVGLYPAWGFSLDENEPFIIYYNQSSGRLMRAQPSPPGIGNCGDDLRWICMDFDFFPGDDIGRYASYAEWTNQSHWRMGFSFYDATNRSLAFRLLSCDNTACTDDYGFVEIPSLNNISIGLYTSIKFNSSGIPYIAYYKMNSTGNDSLMVAHITFDWSGNCGEYPYDGLWECDVVDSGNGVGQYASLDIRWDDQVAVAYYADGSGDLKYAHQVNGGGNCSGGNWDCIIVDGASGANVGLYASLHAPITEEDTLDLAYYDYTGGMLKYASPLAGGNCGGGSWWCMYVDLMGNSQETMGISLDVDPLGNPVIAYQQISSETSPPALRIAFAAWILDDEVFGNCGEVRPGFSEQLWRCSTLDPGSQYADEADYVSLNVSQTGLVGIAYSEDETENPITSLKYIYQYYQTFLPHLRKP